MPAERSVRSISMYNKHIYDQQFEIYYVDSTLVSVAYMNKIYTFPFKC